jgi:hypothetical protein
MEARRNRGGFARLIEFNHHTIRKAFGDRWLKWLQRAFKLPMDLIMRLMQFHVPLLQITPPRWIHTPRGGRGDTLAVDPNVIDPDDLFLFQSTLPGTIQRYTWHRGTQLAYRPGSGSSPPWPYWLPPRRQVLIEGRIEGRG